jgi:hypothetical protein
VIAGHAFIQTFAEVTTNWPSRNPANRRLTVAFDELALVI